MIFCSFFKLSNLSSLLNFPQKRRTHLKIRNDLLKCGESRTYHLQGAALLFLIAIDVVVHPPPTAALGRQQADETVPEGRRAAGVHQKVQRRIHRQQQVAHATRTRCCYIR